MSKPQSFYTFHWVQKKKIENSLNQLKKKSICEKNANLGSFNSVQLKLKDPKLFKSNIK